jgi:UDP-glucuronate 4-epimerase
MILLKGIIRVLDKPANPNQNWNSSIQIQDHLHAPWRIYNIGNNSPVELLDYINAIENA